MTDKAHDSWALAAVLIALIFAPAGCLAAASFANADRGDCASSAQRTGVSDKVPGRKY